MKAKRTSGRSAARVWIAVVWCLAPLVAPSSIAADAHRIAISDFTTDENEWESIKAAADFAPAVQAELAKEPGFEWVERAQLGLAENELALSAALGQPSLANAVRRARWSKADWLVTGTFSSKDGARELLVEVIDLAHADVLTERRIKLPIPANDPLRAALAHLPALAKGLREALRAAEQRERAMAGLPSIAVLFFPDSEVFQREFSAALADPQLTGGPVRVLRLPRAGEALGEAELVLGGFAEDPDGAWRGIADFYAWGSLVPFETGAIDGEAVTDAHTPEITLTVWEGRLSPMRFVEEGEPVARREFDAAVAAQARRLAASVSEAARSRRSGAVDESQRQRISRALLRSAEQIEESNTYRGGFLNRPEGRRHFFNLTQTLEAACFFDPANRAAQEKLVRLRWDRTLRTSMRSQFLFLLGRSEAWGRFVDRFGFPEPKPSVHEQIGALMRAERVDNDRIDRLMRKTHTNEGPSVANEFFTSAAEVTGLAKTGEPEKEGYPRGVPKGDVAQWAQELTLEVARRTILVAGRKDVEWEGGLNVVFSNGGRRSFTLRDARKRIEILDKLWPHLSAKKKADVASQSAGYPHDLRSGITWTYEELGRKSDEEKLFASVPALPPRPPAPERGLGSRRAMEAQESRFERRRAEPDASRLFRMPAITALPTELKPAMEEIEVALKTGVTCVKELALLAGRLWLVGEGFETKDVEGTNRALTGALEPTRYEATRLFSLDAGSGRLERVASAREFTPVSILPHDGLLWLALGSEGVATLDPATGALRRFGAADGLEVTSAYRFGVADGCVFVTANMMDAFVWQPEAKQWKPWSTEFPDYKGGRWGGEIRRLCGLGPWLLLFQRPIGVCDVRSPGWTRYETKLAAEAAIEGFPNVGCVIADARGFWLGGATGLHFLDPQSGETVNRLRPLNAAAAGRQSTAEAVEGFLKRRAALHAHRERRPGSPHPLQPSSPIAGMVSALASDGNFLWVATAAPDSPVGGGGVMLLHKPSGRWVGQFPRAEVVSLATDDKHLWIGSRVGYRGGTNSLARIEKRALYTIPEDRWTPDAVPEAEARGVFERLTAREKALWHFTGGDYAAAAELLVSLEPQTPETLFLQALCYDPMGLNQPEKSRALFLQIISAHAADPLAEEARKQLAQAVGGAAR